MTKFRVTTMVTAYQEYIVEAESKDDVKLPLSEDEQMTIVEAGYGDDEQILRIEEL